MSSNNQSKNQKIQKNVPNKVVSESKSKRRRDKKKKKKGKKQGQADVKKQSPQGGARTSMITPVKQLTLAQGIVKEISIVVQPDGTSIQGIPLAQISLALARGAPGVPYAAYQAYFADIIGICSNGIGAVFTRLTYMNTLLGSLTPKNIPFRDGSIYYSWVNLPALPGAVITNGGNNYYMYVPGPNMSGVWNTQVAPGAYQPSQITDAYTAYIDTLGGNTKHNKATHNVTLTPQYLIDGSAFAQISSYYGRGYGNGSPVSSVELETYFQSPMLPTLVTFSTSTPRSSRYLTYSSGDSVSNWGIGALDVWNTPYYNGAVSPIYKFLDLAELSHMLLSSYVEAVNQYVRDHAELDGEDISLLTGGLGCTWGQWIFMLRQQVLWMFVDSQCLGQFLSPSFGVGAFAPFICSSNTYPKYLPSVLNVPVFINENLKCLKMCVRPYVTKNFNSVRNHITHIPVWGMFINSVSQQYYVSQNDQAWPVFLPDGDDTNLPSFFDGHNNNYVCDINATTLLPEITSTWNAVLMVTNSVWGGLTPLGGESNASPFLQYTRYVTFRSLQAVDVTTKRVPRYLRQYVNDCEVEVIPERTLGRSSSKGDKPVKKIKKFFNPPDSTVFSEYTLTISSLIPPTETLKQYAQYILFPVIEIEPTTLPGQQQVQTSTLEPFTMTGAGMNSFASRGVEISNGVINNVVGLAGKPTELLAYVEALSKAGQGGFMGDLFSAVGSMIPGPIGAIATGIGGVADVFDI